MVITALTPSSANTDTVLHLTAATALKKLIEDSSFDLSVFFPFLHRAMCALFLLLLSVEQCETKMTLLLDLTALIQRVGPVMCNYFDENSVGAINALWHDRQTNGMLRSCILNFLAETVEVNE